MKARTARLIVSVLCASGALGAQEAEEPAALARCAAIDSAVARLDCFDALTRRERGGDAPVQQQQEQQAEQAQSSPRDSSERVAAAQKADAVDAARVSRREERASEREQLEVTSRVAALREIQPGRIEVTLSNGQVWRQTASDRYNLLVGHEVRVYPTGFGQYFRLSSKETRGYMQVERVR